MSVLPAMSLSFAILLALFSGTLQVLLTQTGVLDEGDLYLILHNPFRVGASRSLPRAGISEIGPIQAPFATMATMNRDMHSTMVAAGHTILPASVIADFCGITPDRSTSY